MSRTRSHWGWGWDDRFPDRETRQSLGTFAASLLGFEVGEAREPVALEAISLPPLRIDVPVDLSVYVSADREARIRHTHGRNFRDLVRGFEGDFAAAPDLVAFVRDEADIVALLAWASRERVAVVPYGGGTSVVDGIECPRDPRFRGTVSLDLRALDRVLQIDPVSLAARVQAGATGPGLETQLAPHGLTLRHFPQSFEFSTVGGWIATRAGGHYATLATHIDDRVESVRMITPSGPFETRRLPASGAGPQPERLVLGSEGALGVITEAWLRVVPRPRFRASASVHFETFEHAVAVARSLAQSGLYPSNARLLDAREAMLNQVVDDGHHVLLVAFESQDHALDAWIERAIEIARAHGACCVSGPKLREGDANERGGDAGSWREAFIDAPYRQSMLVSLGMVVDTFETACTWDRFDALHAAVTRAVRDTMKRVCGAGEITCRFTHVYPDGPAPYFTFIAPGRAGEQIAQWTAIKHAASEALSANGATITHHHAVGRLHRPWYDRERPELFARAFEAYKRALDPAGVMNPGVLVDGGD